MVVSKTTNNDVGKMFVFACRMLLFDIPTILKHSAIPSHQSRIGYLISCLYFVIQSFGWCSFLTISLHLLLPSTLAVIILNLILIICALMFTLDCFCLKEYHHLTDDVIVTTILASNIKEIIEFVLSFLLNPHMLIVVLSVFFGLNAYNYILHSLSNHKNLCKQLFLIGIILSLVTYKSSLHHFSLKRLLDIIPRTTEELRKLRQANYNITKQPIRITENNGNVNSMIIILGEATSRLHMSLYGYSLKTNPRLEERKRSGDLVVFRDVISPERITEKVLKKLFNFYNNESPGAWYDYIILFDILKQAGIYTSWISNQETVSVFGNMMNVLSGKCNERHFTTIRRNHQEFKTPFDESVIPIIKRTVPRTGGKRSCMIIHLMGTHLAYKYRYPKSFDVFSSKDETGKTEKYRSIRAQYDNAVLYNDYVVDSIFQLFEHEDALVLYLSDHGEEVYNNNTHPFLGHAIKQLFNSMLEIPFMFYLSPTFRAKHLELVERITSAKDRPYMTDDLIHLILHIFGIRTPEFDLSRSVISESFNQSRRRYVEGIEYRSKVG